MKRRLTLSVSLFFALTVVADAQFLDHRRKAFRLVVGASVTDDFQAYADASNLDAAANWTQITGTISIYDNAGDKRAYVSGGSGVRCIRYSGAAFAANHKATLTVQDAGSAGGLGPAVRCQSGSTSFYIAEWYSDGNCYLIKLNSGTKTDITSAADSKSNGDTLTLEATGTGSATRLTVKKNGTNVTGLVNIDPGGTYIDGGSPGFGGEDNNGPSTSTWTGADL